MTRIAISVEAYEALAATLPLGSVAVEAEANERGERTVWLEEVWVDRLGAMRGPDESYSDVILRIVGSMPGANVKQRIKAFLAGGVLALALSGGAAAGPLEDGEAAYQVTPEGRPALARCMTKVKA